MTNAPTPHSCRFAGLRIDWSTGDLPLDPFAPVMPLALEESHAANLTSAQPDLILTAAARSEPAPSPAAHGATAAIFHGKTTCFVDGDTLVLWDGASTLRIAPDGRRIEASVHASSLANAFHFSSVGVMMALLLALRRHGLYHLHAAAATWPDGETWVIPGESGSGKSTLALAAFASGARFLSDDALLLRRHERGVELVGWARHVRMTSRTSDAYPELRPLLTPCPAGSAREVEVDPRAAFPGQGLASALPPFTLLFPSIADGEQSRVVPLDRAEAFGRALHACAWVASEHLPGSAEQLELLARLVDGAQTFALHAGSRVLSHPHAAIAELRALVSPR